MCGIVGYIGKRDAYPVLIKGLKRLEYRGYDSAGVALIDKKRRLNVYKTKGKVSDLEAFVSQKDVSGTIGIAHTRWATHGEPCQANAHPHFSSSKNLALIHNGIIENYATLKEKLQKKGFIFKSSTDTEVLVQLIEFFQLSNHLDLLTAVQLALHEVIGAYAIAVLDKNNPDEIIAARKSSPLVVGIGKDEFFLASDATPIVEYTDKVVYLQDGEIAVIRRDKTLEVVNLDNVLQNPEVRTVAGITSTLDIVDGALECMDDTEDLREVMKVCVDRCYSMSRFITNFANVVKIPEPQLQLVSLNDRVAACKMFMETVCRNRNITLHLTLCDENPHVRMDTSLFEQVLVNIIKNAAESIGEEGNIFIRTSVFPTMLEIADTGAGISKEVEAKLFSPFFSTKPNGQGIGLIFIREVLMKHGCTFSLRTYSDGLTRFRIRFSA